MEKKILLSLVLLSISLTGFSTIWTVTNSGMSFSPATITITEGDTVHFDLTIQHNAREVSETTWNENGTTALPDGFQTEFSGGMVLPTQLGVGTHYYVCIIHASGGMKGTIIVQNSTTGISVNQLQSSISLYPNPSNGKFQLSIDDSQIARNSIMEIFNLHGARIYQAAIINSITDIELSNQKKGIYFVKIYNGQTILTRKIVIQ